MCVVCGARKGGGGVGDAGLLDSSEGEETCSRPAAFPPEELILLRLDNR